MKAKVPQAVADILSRYDVNSLIARTIPQPENFTIDSIVLEIYKRKSKFDTVVELDITDDTLSIISEYASNYPNYAHVEVFSYLIEMVCDVSRVHTKDIADALDKYYEIAATDPARHIHILDAYADSLYYTGALNERDLAHFLISSDGQKVLNQEY